MKKIIGIFLFLIVTSCTNKKVETNSETFTTDSVSVNTPKVSVKDTTPYCRPTEKFVALIKYMDSCSYHVDTATISESSKTVNTIKLNQESYSNTFIHELLKDSAVYEEGLQSLASVRYDPKYDLKFGKACCIWTYSWRLPDSEDGLKRRGTVEEWTFDSDSSAKFAFDFLINEYKKIGFPFCKTPGFYLQCGKYLYLFHSNHSGVGYRHKPFHKWLSKKCADT
ncbi:MAG: hypothetical protein IT236_02670 [Bacteroidia bacterium]|nr:hypothetical protein [Bacteroidia bacterium]